MAWWKWALVAALMFIGLWETFTKQGAIEQTMEVFLDDPIRGTFLTIERWFVWEALTPVWEVSPGVYFFWYSLWDTFILAFVGVVFIITLKGMGLWPSGMRRWVLLGIFLVLVWFMSKGIFHAMWLNNNAAFYGLSAEQSDEMLLATSGMSLGIIGLMNLIVSAFLLPILYKVVDRVG